MGGSTTNLQNLALSVGRECDREDMLRVIRAWLLAAVILGGEVSCADRAATCDARLNDNAQQLRVLAGNGELGTAQAEGAKERMGQTLKECRNAVSIKVGYSANDPFPQARNGLTVLDLAAMADDAKLVREYLNKGVSLYGVPGWESNHFTSEASTLHVAATYGSHLAMKELLRDTRSASPQDRMGNTPLMQVPGYFEAGRRTMALLLDRHVDLEAADKEGRSALALAVVRNDVEKVRILLGAGATVDVLLDGVTLPEYASQHGQHEISELLKQGT